jgi:hypothetical protein
MFSMFIFDKQLRQQMELEEVNATEAICALRDTARIQITANKETYAEGITVMDASDFIDAAYLSGFKVSIKKEGQKLSAIIVSPTKLGRHELDNLSAARISSMLGASGGFVPFIKGEPSSLASGTLGLWSLDVKDFFGASFADPVRIVIHLEFSEEESTASLSETLQENLLFRTAVEGYPDGNKMLTDIDMNNHGLVDVSSLQYRDAEGNVRDGIFIDAKSGTITLPAKTADRSVASGFTDAESGSNVVGGSVPSDNYRLDPAGLSIMKDIQLEDLGGAKLSDIVPKLSLQASYRNRADGSYVPAPGFAVIGSSFTRTSSPTCPPGYAPYIELIPRDMAAGESKSFNVVVPAVNCTISGNTANCPGGTVSSSVPADFSGAGASAMAQTLASGGQTYTAGWRISLSGHYLNADVDVFCKAVK